MKKPLFFTLAGLLLFGGGYFLGNVHPLLWRDGKASLAARADWSRLDEVWGLIEQNYVGTPDRPKAVSGAISGLVLALGDPYSTYFDSADAALFRSELSSTVSGVGAEMAIKNEQLTVVAPLEGSPAAAAGIKPGDIVKAIDGASTAGLSLGDAVMKIRGAAGSPVKLLIARPGMPDIEITIKRSDIRVPAASSRMLEGTVGYIKINSFTNDAGDSFKGEENKLLAGGASAVVLDLRSNPGGYLDQAVSIASEFIADGLVVKEGKSPGSAKVDNAAAGGKLTNIPVAVLIDKGSASAAEILAGALRVRRGAKLFGEQSFGKGTVQIPFELSDGSLLKLTIGRWYLPDGSAIDGQGLKPDTIVAQAAGSDETLAAALKYLESGGK